jgi:hypothetical protein
LTADSVQIEKKERHLSTKERFYYVFLNFRDEFNLIGVCARLDFWIAILSLPDPCDGKKPGLGPGFD